MLETHRRLYNQCLDIKKTLYEVKKENISRYELQKWFTKEKKGNPYFARINHTSAQRTIQKLDRAFQNFYRRIKQKTEKPGYPKFKTKDRFHSIDFTYPNGIKILENGKLRVQHVGTISVIFSRPIKGKIKSASIKRENNKWFVIFTCEIPNESTPKTTRINLGAIDVGLESFYTNEKGEQEPNPRYYKKILSKLKQVQRKHSRKKKGSKNRRKHLKKLQNIHTKVKNCRRDHHFKVAKKLVQCYGAIAVESLDIKGMLKNRRLARSISDAGWGQFINILKHQAAKAGVRIVEVDPRGTSQICCWCDGLVSKDLSVRWHDCPHCGLSIHRDHNSALNISQRGMEILLQEELAGTRPVDVKQDNSLVCPRSH